MCQILNSIIMTLASSAIGGAAGGAIGGWFAVRAASNSIREASRLAQETSLKSSITAPIMEVRENLSALEDEELQKQLKAIDDNINDKKVYIQLSNFTWNNCRNEVGRYDEFDKGISDILCDAYIAVGKIITNINASFNFGMGAYSSLSDSVKKAISSLRVAKQKLENLNVKYASKMKT